MSDNGARYQPETSEPRMQQQWLTHDTSRSDVSCKSGAKYYCLEMFPYPSGKLHMGHVRNYTIGDAIARFHRMNGRDVIHPIGFDSFGLPAENAANSGGQHPRAWTLGRIDEMTEQMRRMGFSYDWERLTRTCMPDYYRWNQWLFLKFWERGLVYRKAATVNWCPKCATVLANEQVHDGMCWRHDDTPVDLRKLEQWFVKITDYAERLLDNLDGLTGWPDHVKEMQRHWIGRSVGAVLKFPVVGRDVAIETFTTRPDTVYGITYLVLSPEHPLVDQLVVSDRIAGLTEFRAFVAKQSLQDRTDITKPKHGFALGRNFVNPFTGREHPLYVADYALMDYGTGAVMAVPAHDQRDFEFARAHGLPIVPVIHPEGETLMPEAMTAAYEEDGVMRNSGTFDGQTNRAAWQGIVDLAEKKGWGRPHVQFRLRDWLISRQRYWGTPIPAVYCATCGVVPILERDLPVLLPDDVSFGAGGNPLATSTSFVTTTCPKCGGPARRETDTMDTFVDSSWYFLRYLDAANDHEPFDPARAAAGMPVDQYIGGVEHACMHLIYARFFTMVLHDLGLVPVEEPFTNLLTQGMVTLATYRCPQHDWISPTDCVDGKCRLCGSEVTIGPAVKMSKSRKNTVDPGEIINRYGADTARTFILFASPPEKELLWSDQALEGSFRFLRRVFSLVEDRSDQETAAPIPADKELRRKAHQTIQRVTRDIAERFQFNTAIAALMELLNALIAHGQPTAVAGEALEILLKCLFPIAPHLAEERWERLGRRLGRTGLIGDSGWPAVEASALVTSLVEVPVTMNGKLKGKVQLAPDANESDALSAAGAQIGFDPAAVKKVIYKPGRILNLVV